MGRVSFPDALHPLMLEPLERELDTLSQTQCIKVIVPVTLNELRILAMAGSIWTKCPILHAKIGPCVSYWVQYCKLEESLLCLEPLR
jgi:hypothetical protein